MTSKVSIYLVVKRSRSRKGDIRVIFLFLFSFFFFWLWRRDIDCTMYVFLLYKGVGGMILITMLSFLLGCRSVVQNVPLNFILSALSATGKDESSNFGGRR